MLRKMGIVWCRDRFREHRAQAWSEICISSIKAIPAPGAISSYISHSVVTASIHATLKHFLGTIYFF